MGLKAADTIRRDVYGTTSAACSLLISSGSQGLATVDMEEVANQENEFESIEQLQTDTRLEQVNNAHETLSDKTCLNAANGSFSPPCINMAAGAVCRDPQ